MNAKVVNELAGIQKNVIGAVRAALGSASTPEELLEVARAAAGTGDHDLMLETARRIGGEIEAALESSGSWEAEMLYNKLDAWQNTGHRATLLAQAWGAVRAPLTG